MRFCEVREFCLQQQICLHCDSESREFVDTSGSLVLSPNQVMEKKQRANPSLTSDAAFNAAFKAPKRRLNDEGGPWCYAPAKNGGLCLVASRRRAESRGRGALATEKKLNTRTPTF